MNRGKQTLAMRTVGNGGRPGQGWPCTWNGLILWIKTVTWSGLYAWKYSSSYFCCEKSKRVTPLIVYVGREKGGHNLLMKKAFPKKPNLLTEKRLKKIGWNGKRNLKRNIINHRNTTDTIRQCWPLIKWRYLRRLYHKWNGYKMADAFGDSPIIVPDFCRQYRGGNSNRCCGKSSTNSWQFS